MGNNMKEAFKFANKISSTVAEATAPVIEPVIESVQEQAPVVEEVVQAVQAPVTKDELAELRAQLLAGQEALAKAQKEATEALIAAEEANKSAAEARAVKKLPKTVTVIPGEMKLYSWDKANGAKGSYVDFGTGSGRNPFNITRVYLNQFISGQTTYPVKVTIQEHYLLPSGEYAPTANRLGLAFEHIDNMIAVLQLCKSEITRQKLKTSNE